MRKIVLPIIIFSLLFGAIVFAQEAELPNPGLTPDSVFYFLDTLGEKIGMFFTFGAEKKAEKAMKIAEEKLAEVKAMAERNKTKALEKANQKYQEFLDLASQRAKEAKEKGKDVEKLVTLISEKTLQHQEVLLKVFEKVPQEAKKGIEKAIEVSEMDFKEAVRAVSGAKKEELEKKGEEIKIKIGEKIGAPKEKLEEVEIPEKMEMPEEKVEEAFPPKPSLPEIPKAEEKPKIEIKIPEIPKAEEKPEIPVEWESDFTPPRGKTIGPEKLGPWNKRLMSAISTDGLNFVRTNKVITDQGDVPDLIQDSKGWVYLYYTGWTIGNEQNKTVVAISKDGGKNWIYKKLRLEGFGGSSRAGAVDPDIQILPDGTFRLYLTWHPEDVLGPRTYYAEGKDGINFTNKGVAFLRPGREVLDPSTLKIGSNWHIFAGGRIDVPGGNWHGISSDGESFTFDEIKTFVKDGKYQAMANGIPVPGGYRFYTFSHGDNPTINSFFTTDGITWEADPGTRLGLDHSSGLESWGVMDPAIIRLSDGTYLMIYVTKIP